MSRDTVLMVQPSPALRRGLKLDEAAAYIGFGRTKFLEMVDDGRMPKPARIDGSVRWDIRKLDLAFDDLFGNDDPPADDPYTDTSA